MRFAGTAFGFADLVFEDHGHRCAAAEGFRDIRINCTSGFIKRRIALGAPDPQAHFISVGVVVFLFDLISILILQDLGRIINGPVPRLDQLSDGIDGINILNRSRSVLL